jgi:hypothetical protein
MRPSKPIGAFHAAHEVTTKRAGAIRQGRDRTHFERFAPRTPRQIFKKNACKPRSRRRDGRIRAVSVVTVCRGSLARGFGNIALQGCVLTPTA